MSRRGREGAEPETTGTEGRRVAVRTPRQARLTLSRIDPWSVLKLSLLLAMCLLVVLLVAVFVLYTVLDAARVFDSVDETLQAISPSLSAADYFNLSRVLGTTAFLGAVNVVLITALSTLAAFLYNLCAGLLGGLDVTLTEER